MNRRQLARDIDPTLPKPGATPAGIHDDEGALSMIEAGATRIGASRGVTLVEGAPA